MPWRYVANGSRYDVYNESNFKIATTETEVVAQHLVRYYNRECQLILSLTGGIVQCAFGEDPLLELVVVDWDVDNEEQDHTYAIVDPESRSVANKGYDTHAWVYYPQLNSFSRTCQEVTLAEEVLLADIEAAHTTGGTHPKGVTWQQILDRRAEIRRQQLLQRAEGLSDNLLACQKRLDENLRELRSQGRLKATQQRLEDMQRVSNQLGELSKMLIELRTNPDLKVNAQETPQET